MDLSQLSTEDLMALKSGDISKVSTQGLVALKSMQQPQAQLDPTAKMSNFQKFAAGGGKAIYDIGRGIGQMAGLVSQAEIDRARELDKALMNTGAGVAGNVTGNIISALPTAFIPGVNTVTGGAAIGAGLSALQPTATGESRLQNAGIGAVAGGALPALLGAGKVAKSALYDPLAGQDNVIAGALTRLSGNNPKALAQALKQGNKGATKGVNLPAGAISENEGLSALEDAIRTQLPSGNLAKNAQQNRNALAEALRNVAKTPEEMQLAEQARENATTGIYNKITSGDYQLDGNFNELLKRPAVQQAMKEAEINALNRGAKIKPIEMSNSTAVSTNTSGVTPQVASGQSLHELKMALDSAKQYNPMGGANKAQSGAIGEASSAYNQWLESTIPEYATAKNTFSSMSKPINEMQVGKYLAEKLIPATAGDSPATLNYASLAKSMQNPDIVAQRATGFSGARFNDAVSPEAQKTIKSVTSDASKIAEYLKRGAGAGSPTARRLAQGDILAQHFAQNAPVTAKVLEVVGKLPPVTLASKGMATVGGIVTDRVKGQLLDKMDDMLANNPQEVARLIEQELSRVSPTQRQQIIRALPQSIVLGLSANRGQ